MAALCQLSGHRKSDMLSPVTPNWQKLVYNYLLIAPHVIILFAVVGMAQKRLQKRYPVFFVWAVYNIVEFAVLYPILSAPSVNKQLYFKVYCVAVGIEIALRFAIVGEISGKLFKEETGLARLGKPVLRAAVVVLFIGAIVISKYAGTRDPDPSYAILFSLDRAASIIQCALFMALLCLTSYLHLSWRRQLLGILLGFGVFSSVELILASLLSLNPALQEPLNYVVMGTYHVCVLIWTYYLFVPERKQQFAIGALPNHDIEVWNQELQQLLQK